MESFSCRFSLALLHSTHSRSRNPLDSRQRDRINRKMWDFPLPSHTQSRYDTAQTCLWRFETHIVEPRHLVWLRIRLNQALEIHVGSFFDVVRIQRWSHFQCHNWRVCRDSKEKVNLKFFLLVVAFCCILRDLNGSFDSWIVCINSSKRKIFLVHIYEAIQWQNDKHNILQVNLLLNSFIIRSKKNWNNFFYALCQWFYACQ